MGNVTGMLYKLASKWEEEARLDPDSSYPFRGVLDEILFHADLRFIDYVQYRQEGEFPVRLQEWLGNVSEDRHKKVLFQVLRRLCFIDAGQLRSLYRDAYRRSILPTISEELLSPLDMLSPQYEANMRKLVARYRLLSITESFGFSEFLHVNDLSGLSHPIVLGEEPKGVKERLSRSGSDPAGLIVFEDFVGSGDQATRVLSEVAAHTSSSVKILFVPLMILESGLRRLLSEVGLTRVHVRPGLVVSESNCLLEPHVVGEPLDFSAIRALVRETATRVLEPLPPLDDPPTDPFGYRGSGALLVTAHNTPNNTIPLIHHRAPSWAPLFRRVHHSNDGLR